MQHRSTYTKYGVSVDHVAHIWGTFVRRYGKILDIGRERRVLQGLDDHMLKDIGLTRQQADREASLGFWQIPENRR